MRVQPDRREDPVVRTREADRHVKHQFEARRTVEKTYLAIACGSPDEDTFRADLPLQLDPTSRYKVKMRVAATGAGLTAATGFEVLGRRSRAADGGSPAALGFADRNSTPPEAISKQ